MLCGLMLCGLAASCAAPIPVAVPVAAEPPHFLTVCEAPRTLPLPPPPPRTAAQLFDWARRLQAVALVNAGNLAVCQGRIARLNAWWQTRLPSQMPR